jgi:hypothetical protein
VLGTVPFIPFYPSQSYLAGVGIRSSLGAGLSSNWDFGRMWNSVTTGLLQGVTNIGLNFATQGLGLDPLLANLGFSAISTAINAGIQVGLGVEKDVFGSLFSTYKQNTLTFLGYADPKSPSYAWQEAAYIAQIQDFTKIVMERGLVEALNAYGTGFFNAVAVNSIVQSGQTIGDYFKRELDGGRYNLRTLKDGKEIRVVGVIDKDGNIVTNVFFNEKQDGASFFWDVVGAKDLFFL